jgi:1-hydroxycarotenoid 3,4-desaturase
LPKHVVVIGAGMGGLSATLELAATGYRVTVIERASRPGGKLHEIEVDGRRIDSGPTVFTMRWVFEELFRVAGLELAEHLDLVPATVLARHSWPDGSRLDLFADVEASAAAIERFSGTADAAAYRRFAAESEAIFDTLDHSFMRRDKPSPIELSLSLGVGGVPRLYATRPFVTLWRELGRIFDDPRLRQLFGRYATYCGSSPFEAPATLMLIAHAERAGVWLVEGGMQRLADAVAAAATSAGADIRYDTEAREIRRSSQHGFSVMLADETILHADAVVFNGDVAALEKGLLGDSVTRAIPSRSKETRSLSAITWSAVANVRDFPLSHHTVFFGSDYQTEFDCIFRDRTICPEPTVYVCAQDRSGADKVDRSAPERLFMLVNAPPVTLSDAELDRAESAAFALLESQGLSIDPSRIPVERRTPDDFDARFPGSGGAIYGWPTHGWFGSFRRSGSETRLPGLFCAGGTVHPGPGIPMATLSGRIAAGRVRAFLN